MKAQPVVQSSGDDGRREAPAPRGTFSGAALVSPYFRIEHFRHNLEQGKWRVPFSTKTAVRLRRRIAEARRKLGIEHISDAVVPRPGAGQPLVGPIGLPIPRPRRPLPAVVHPVRPDYRVSPDALTRPGMTWAFRAAFHRQAPDRRPLFTCIGLEG